MTVLCPGCRREIRVPPDKEDVPGLRAKCARCGTSFAVAEASLAPARASQPAAPVPPPAPRPVPARSAAAAVAPAAAGKPVPPPRAASPRASSFRRCANHGDRPSEAVCTSCGKGWCPECLQRQGTAAICASCDALCVPTAEREAREARARQRARPLSAETGTILRYPFTDGVAFVLFALFVGAFAFAASIAAFGGGFGVLFSQGLLYAYAFTALNRVSAGDMSGFMPEISDIGDLVGPLRVGLAALIVSSGPLVAMTFLYPPTDVLQALGAGHAAATVAPSPSPSPEPTLDPGVAAALEDDSGDEAADPPANDPGEMAPEVETPLVPGWALGAYVLAVLWKLVYSPIAFVAGAISRSFVRTLNPVVGLDAMRRMGPTYWSAMVLYGALALGEFAAGSALSLVPFVGGFLRAFVQSYSYLAIGCLLGLAVFKKAPELGLD
jgi:hypothetical protein